MGDRPCPEVVAVELSIGRELLGLALLIGLLVTVMWVLSTTKGSPR